MADYKKLVPFILAKEGGFVDDKDDLGGATMKGVTFATFQYYMGKNKTIADLKNITNDQWMVIFKQGFWNNWRADDIDDHSVANILVDWVWASGANGIKWPQAMLGLVVDGIVGQNTLLAVNMENPKELFDKVRADRLRYIEYICKRRPQNMKFRRGWINRVNTLEYGK